MDESVQTTHFAQRPRNCYEQRGVCRLVGVDVERLPAPSAAGSRCTAQLPDGDFCNYPSMRDAPFPICKTHARQAFEFGSQLVASLDAPRAGAQGQALLDRLADSSQAYLPVPKESVVYYVQVGDLIKIGYTTNLRSRMNSYPPNRRLLATEHASWTVEAERHRQFKDTLRHGKEWFAPSPALVAHINALRAANGNADIHDT